MLVQAEINEVHDDAIHSSWPREIQASYYAEVTGGYEAQDETVREKNAGSAAATDDANWGEVGDQSGEAEAGDDAVRDCSEPPGSREAAAVHVPDAGDEPADVSPSRRYHASSLYWRASET